MLKLIRHSAGIVHYSKIALSRWICTALLTISLQNSEWFHHANFSVIAIHRTQPCQL